MGIKLERIAKGLYWERAWSLVGGCTPVSEGCDNCWSARETRMRANHPNEKIRTRNTGLITGTTFNGKIRINEDLFDLPLQIRKPTVWSVWNDLFHESIDWSYLDDIFRVIYKSFREELGHVFLILTKRPLRMERYLEDRAWRYKDMKFMHNGWAPPNVWLGVTCENQRRADERIPILLQIPAVVRFVSVEPMLGPVNLIDNGYLGYLEPECNPALDWVICGGESGPNARPMHPNWPKDLRDQCKDAEVPFFFKQWGSWVSVSEVEGPGDHYHFEDGATVRRTGKKKAGRLLDGRTWDEMPK